MDKRFVLRVRQGSMLLGALIVLVAGTLWLTGVLRQTDQDDYSGANHALDPKLVDPALIALETEASASAPALAATNSTMSPTETSTPTENAAATSQASPSSTSSSPASAQASAEAAEDGATDASDAGNGTATNVQTNGNSSESTEATPSPAIATAEAEGDTLILDAEALPGSGDWLEARIQKHLDEIDPTDLQDFRHIIARLDQDYIGSMASDDWTVEEQEALRGHLHSRLSDADYARSKELFVTYNVLLEEE